MTTEEHRRSASGARQSGDDYQHLVAWSRLLRATLPDRALEAVELEAIGAGNVDDVVLHYGDRPSAYTQVRFAVDLRTPLSTAYLLDRSARGGTSVLQKFARSWRTLRPAPEGMNLITNRAPDSNDPVIVMIDGRTGMLVPALATASATRARSARVEHLECTDSELIQMLGCLRFQLGRGYDAEMEVASGFMAAAGVRSDSSAVRAGIDLVRQWVLAGRRRLSSGDVRSGIAALGLEVADPAAILHVQALARDPSAAEADEALDWVDFYHGDSPAERRRTTRPDAYSEIMQPQLLAAARRLLASGHRRIVVRGAFRLPAAFAIGAALPRVADTVLLRQQGQVLWSTDALPRDGEGLSAQRTDVGPGNDMALVVAVSLDPTPDVARYISASRPTVGAILTVYPAHGGRDTSISDAGHAVALCQAIVGEARSLVQGREDSRIHIFLACPAALALFLGHRWNRVAPAIIYEDLAPGYEPSFTTTA